ncbi:MAG TPA: hypothetical protein VGG99_26075 [Acetobacteraceae bacterium]|jgi:hypothetical protein
MRPRPTTVFGLPLVLLALAVQIAVGAIVLQPQMMELMQLSQTSPICHANTPADDHSPAAPHRAPHCMFCPLCAAVATSGHVLSGAQPPLPVPPQIVALSREGMPPPATAPPVASPNAAQPRGPPILA